MVDFASVQYLRKMELVVGNSTDSLDLSALSVEFTIDKADSETPNTGTIRIFNLADETVAKIQKEYRTVLLSAGYESNFGSIFHANIKKTTWGREGTETVLEIEAGDGDESYTTAIVSTTVAAGSTYKSNAKLAAEAMAGVEINWVTSGPSIEEIPDDKPLPRAKVMHGMARDVLRNVGKNIDSQWSVQDGKVEMLANKSYRPGDAIVITSRNGMIDTPKRTEEGISLTTLLNPTLKIGYAIQIDEGRLPNAAAIDKQFDGLYKVIKISHTGAIRGNEWYSEIEAESIDQSGAATQVKSK
ncbi:MAG: phage protein [Burkholderiales bacterium]